MQGTLAMAIGLVLGLAFGLVASATQSPGLLAFASGIEPLGSVSVGVDGLAPRSEPQPPAADSF